MPTPDDLLRRLADRGTPRGPAAVFAGANAPRRPPALLGLAVAALLLAGTVAVVADDGGDAQDTTSIAAPDPTDRPGGGDLDLSAGTPSSVPPTAPGAGTPGPGAGTGDATSSTTTAPDGTVLPVGASPAVVTSLRAHRSCDAALADLQALALPVVGPYGLNDGHARAVPFGGGAEGAPAPAAGDGSGTAGGGAGGGGSSTSNVQEVGVDEPDLAKTDGRVIVAIARGRLQIVSVADRALASSLALPHRPESLFLTGTTVVAIGSVQAYADPARTPAGDEVSGRPVDRIRTPVVLVDIADPTAPRVRSTTFVDGSIRTARLQNGVVRLVLADGPHLAWAAPQDGSDAAQARAVEENRARIRASTLTDWLPTYRTVDAAGTTTAEGLASDCGSTYTPTEESGFASTTIVTIDPASGRLDPGTAVTTSPHTVYASAQSLYVVATVYDGRPEPGRPDGPPIDSRSEIHRFDLADPTSAPYTSSGTVPGTPVDQFALSERDGVLRIATTWVHLDDPAPPPDGQSRTELLAPPTDPDTESGVFALRRDGDRLPTIGAVGGLGKPGERIFSVRFEDRAAYVTTFRRIDPLYVVDLADPTAPRVLGALEVPGFSTFLQSVGGGRLFGVGREADGDGLAGALQFSLFDVSNPAAPSRTSALTFADASSDAEHDHLAFLHWAATDLVVTPLYENGADQCSPFAGAVLVRVDGGTLREIGRVSHARHLDRAGSVAPIRRSLVAAGALVTVSDLGLAFGDLGSGAEAAFVGFPGDEQAGWQICAGDAPATEPEKPRAVDPAPGPA